MKKKLVLLLLAGSVIMQGAGIQPDVLQTAEASENLMESAGEEATGVKEAAGVKEATGVKEAAGVEEDTGIAETEGTADADASSGSELQESAENASAKDAATAAQPPAVDITKDGRMGEEEGVEQKEQHIDGADQEDNGILPAETGTERPDQGTDHGSPAETGTERPDQGTDHGSPAETGTEQPDQGTDNVSTAEKDTDQAAEHAEDEIVPEESTSDNALDQVSENQPIIETTEGGKTSEIILPPIETLLVPRDDSILKDLSGVEILEEKAEKTDATREQDAGMEEVSGKNSGTEKEKPDQSSEKKNETGAEQDKTDTLKPVQEPAAGSSGQRSAPESTADVVLEEDERGTVLEESNIIRSAESQEENIAMQRNRKTEQLQNLLDAAEVEISTGKDAAGKENLTMTLAGTKPAKVSIKLIRLDGATSGKTEDSGGQVIMRREITPGKGAISQSVTSAQAEAGTEDHSWEMEILSVEDTESILQAIPDNDGMYQISVTYEDEEGNSASRDIPFKVNRFGSIYVYNQICRDLQDAYVQKVAEDLVISEYNPDRLIAKSLRVEITRDGEPIDRVYFTVQEASGAEQKHDGMYGWYRYDYTISRKNFEKDGIYQVSVSSTDEAGNEPDSMDYSKRTVRFRVDSTKPEVDFLQETNRHLMTKTETMVRYQAFDAIRLKRIRVLLNGKLYEEISEIPEATKYQGSVRLTGFGKHKLQIEITDMAGNQYTSERTLIHGIPAWIYAVTGVFASVVAGASAWLAHRRKQR
ncbi:MAG: hypothetical protein LIV24_03225 [Eubacterium sp.]|nr:hypothetical protein [Eubacterium sp.]